MPKTLYKFNGLEIARDEDGTYYLVRNGKAEVHSKEWRLIVTTFFGEAEMRVLNAIQRYEQEQKEIERIKAHEMDKP